MNLIEQFYVPYATQNCPEHFPWFMESSDDSEILHWDHEPVDRAVASWSAAVMWRFGDGGEPTKSASGLAHSKTWRGLRQFMESPLGLAAVL